MQLYDREKDESTKDYAYRVLKKNIMNLDLKPGDVLSEKDIANELGLSRTPIREVVMKLKEDHLLEVIPQKGTYVSLIDIDLMNEGTFMRVVLEVEILKLACESFPEDSIDKLEMNLFAQKIACKKPNAKIEMHRLDQKFHEIIFNGVNKSNIWDSIQKISSQYNRVRVLSELSKGTEHIVIEHERILDVIKNKRYSAVNEVIDNHIKKPTKHWHKLYDEGSELRSYFKV